MRALIAAAMLASFLSPQAVLADPLHKFGKSGEWRHAESGWVFPTLITGLKREGSPYTIDGNNDVGAEYSVKESDGHRIATAFVDIFLPDSAATSADLAGAKAALLDSAGGSPKLTEAPFPIAGKPEVKGTRFAAVAEGSTELRLLYFFTAPGCVIGVRATVPFADAKAGDSMDEFVRAMRWDALGVFDDHMHSGGS